MTGKTHTDGADLAALLNAAASRHQAGDLAGADAQYRVVLQQAPDHPQALYLAGALAFQIGAADEARTKLEHSLRLRGDYLPAIEMLGAAAAKAGDFTRAAQCFTTVAAKKPDSTEAHYNLGYALLNGQAYDDAANALRRAVELKPEAGQALHLLAAALRLSGRMDEAAGAYEQLVAREPRNGRVLDEYGGVLIMLGRMAEAEVVLRRAIASAPDMANPYTNLGRIFQTDLMRADAAVTLHDQALARSPGYADAHNNRGVALYTLSRFAEAIDSFNAAIALKPTLCEAFNNLGNALYRTGDATGAIQNFQRAVALNPDYAEAHWNLAVAHLTGGNFAAGWTEYGWRWRCKDFTSPPRRFAQPQWHGQPMDQGMLLLWGEQGLGEEILCAGMAADIVATGTSVVWECDARLATLITRSFPGVRAIARRDPPGVVAKELEVHAQISTADLGQYLRNTPADFPKNRLGYLKADKHRMQAYRTRLLSNKRTRLVGISWISKNPEFGVHKSCGLLDLPPLWQAAGEKTRFVDLQYGDTTAERVATASDLAHLDDLDLTNDIDSLAALIAACDLVITVSNTTAHLAGALGIPTWIMAPAGNGKLWYWGDNTKSPWYPSVTIFRQSAAGAWGDVIAKIAQHLGAAP